MIHGIDCKKFNHDLFPDQHYMHSALHDLPYVSEITGQTICGKCHASITLAEELDTVLERLRIEKNRVVEFKVRLVPHKPETLDHCGHCALCRNAGCLDREFCEFEETGMVWHLAPKEDKAP